ncbi:Phage major capsid protein E [Streptococcus gallolyticus]|uniref:Phage major capsid protein E n=1 Tax=Streptococcus gallolyticus TaxID=315405 RepID=A0A1I7JLH8_9STRE|nr:major capsid protein [Streptococcus gallolyticus]SFC84844.1 Phage major capsid protein E [Streptococcus gallolyticus]SFU86003.1 Phage major capsid protein E [Streptococcus gallolyticus]
MPLIYDIITAGNVAGYWNASQQEVDSTIGEKVFPAKKQLGLKLSYVKGASGRPVVLKPSAFDTKATLRERMNVELIDKEMPFFKEAMLVKEADRQQLNVIAQTGNQALIDTITAGLFDDTTTLLSGARAQLEAMRMSVLATGKIAVLSNGVALDYDYGVEEDHKGAVSTAWSDAETATPLNDIDAAITAIEELGNKAEVLYMNAKTFAQLKNAKSTTTLIKPLAPTGAAVTNQELKDYIQDNYGLTIVVKSGTYKDANGEIKKYFPDDKVTFAPNAALGSTTFGTTPEESDLIGGNNAVEVSVVDTGIAITTKKLDDPVNVQTKVSMIALPSFENIDEVYMLSTTPEV